MPRKARQTKKSEDNSSEVGSEKECIMSDEDEKFNRKAKLPKDESKQDEPQKPEQKDPDDKEASATESATEDEEQRVASFRGRGRRPPTEGGRGERFAGRSGGRLPRRKVASSLDFNYNEMMEKHPTLANVPFEELVKYLIARTYTENKFGFCTRLKGMLQEMNGEVPHERLHTGAPPPYRGGTFRGRDSRGGGRFGSWAGGPFQR